MKKIYVGTSGWSYEHWNEVFYPTQQEKLSYYSRFFKTVEVNTTFYHLPKNKVILNWKSQVPRTFLFSVKASRFITHVKRLRNCSESLKLFYRSIRSFQKQLGPILFQLPPTMSCDVVRLQEFITLLKTGFKYVFEFRSSSWYVDEVYELLTKNKIALCISDLNGTCTPLKVTAPFIYVRLHGPKQSYKGSYGKKRLTIWKEKIIKWSTEDQRTVYIYFDNDEKGLAVRDAQMLISLLRE